MPFNWLKWHSPWIFQLSHICFFPQGALKPSCSTLWLNTLKDAGEYTWGTLHISLVMQTDQQGICNSPSILIYPQICLWVYEGQKRDMVPPLWQKVYTTWVWGWSTGSTDKTTGASARGPGIQVQEYTWWLTTSYNSSPRGSNILSCPVDTRHAHNA